MVECSFKGETVLKIDVQKGNYVFNIIAMARDILPEVGHKTPRSLQTKGCAFCDSIAYDSLWRSTSMLYVCQIALVKPHDE